MALFSGKIITAHYIDTEYSMIELMYEGEDGNLYSHALRVDPSNPEYQALLDDGWDEDKLSDGTAEYKRRSMAAFNREVLQAAQILIREKYGYAEDDGDGSVDADLIDPSFSWDTVFDKIDTMNHNKEEIFKFKIWAFESKKMKNASQEVKKELRKATTLIDSLKIYISVAF